MRGNVSKTKNSSNSSSSSSSSSNSIAGFIKAFPETKTVDIDDDDINKDTGGQIKIHGMDIIGNNIGSIKKIRSISVKEISMEAASNIEGFSLKPGVMNIGSYDAGAERLPTAQVIWAKNTKAGNNKKDISFTNGDIFIGTNSEATKTTFISPELRVGTEDKKYVIEVLPGGSLKLRSVYPNAKNTHNSITLGEDISIVGDICIKEPNINCSHLPDDITSEEIEWLSGHLADMLLQLRRLLKTELLDEVESVEYVDSGIEPITGYQVQVHSGKVFLPAHSNTAYIAAEVDNIKKLRVTCRVNNNVNYGMGYVLVDNEENVIEQYNVSDSIFQNTVVELDIPETAHKIYVSGNLTFLPKIELAHSTTAYQSKSYTKAETYTKQETDDAILKLKNEIIDQTSFSIFRSFGVIGDSYASGELGFDNKFVDHYSISWGQILARKTGTTCVNLSSGGLTTETWLSKPHGLQALNAAEPLDLYIIALGINDSERGGADYLGSINDVEGVYEERANSFFGNYSRIVDSIKNKNENALIIFSTMSTNTGMKGTYNQAIIELSEYYGVPCIKQYEDDFFTSDLYMDNRAGYHPVGVVYAGMACAMERLIKECMVENIDYFFDFYRNNTETE